MPSAEGGKGSPRAAVRLRCVQAATSALGCFCSVCTACASGCGRSRTNPMPCMTALCHMRHSTIPRIVSGLVDGSITTTCEGRQGWLRQGSTGLGHLPAWRHGLVSAPAWAAKPAAGSLLPAPCCTTSSTDCACHAPTSIAVPVASSANSKMGLRLPGPPRGPGSPTAAIRLTRSGGRLQPAPWQQWRQRGRRRQPRAEAADPSGRPPPPPPPPPPRNGRRQQQHQKQQHGSWPVRLGACTLATAAALAAATLLPGRVGFAHASPCGVGIPPLPPPAAAAAAAAAAATTAQPPVAGGQLASISIGSTSPSFQPERAVDVAAFKLAGLAQRILSANILVKVGSRLRGPCVMHCFTAVPLLSCVAAAWGLL